MLTEVDWQTFFDVDFDPEIVVGPKVLEFLRGDIIRLLMSFSLFFG